MDRTICAEVKLAEKSRLRQLLGSGRSGIGSPAMSPAAVPALVDVEAEGHDSETDFDAPDAGPELSGTLCGWPDTKWPFGWTRPQQSRAGRPNNESRRGLGPVMRGDAEEPPAKRSANGSAASMRRSTPFPEGSLLRERPPEGRGEGCENTPGPEPVPSPRAGGSPLHGPGGSCATTGCTAEPQDVAAPPDMQVARCAPPERENVH